MNMKIIIYYVICNLSLCVLIGIIFKMGSFLISIFGLGFFKYLDFRFYEVFFRYSLFIK